MNWLQYVLLHKKIINYRKNPTQCTHPLCSNQKIYTKLRTAITRYQAMKVFNLNNSLIEFRIHLKRQHLNKEDHLGEMLGLVYDSFLIDTY